MATALLLAVVAALAAAAALSRPGPALAVVIGTIVLVPGSLLLPGIPGIFTIHRLVVLAALAGLLWRCRRGQVPWRVLRLPPVAYRFLLALGVLAVVAVGLLQPSTDAAQAARSWQALAAQGLVLVTVVALARAQASTRAGVLALVLATGVAAAIAVAEHVTGASYARLWYRAVPELLGSDPAGELATRGGQVRVRAAADFALAFGWTTAAVAPLAVVAAAATRGWLRRLLLLTLPVVLLAVVWTYSRSVMLPLLVAVVLVALAIRDRAVQAAVAAVLAGTGLLVAARPSLLANFSASADQGSIDVRLDRLPAIAGYAADHPWTGLGLGGLKALGFPATDSTFLLGYAELGALGVAAFVGLLLAATAAASRGLLDPDGTRPTGLAAATGCSALLLLVGALSFDVFTTPTSAETFWVVVALGVVAGEGARHGLLRLWVPVSARLGALVALAGVGLVLRVTAPGHVAQTWQFDTLDPVVATGAAPDFTGRQLRTTLCELVTDDLTGVPDADVTCGALDTRPGQDAPGQGLLRLQAADVAELQELKTRSTRVIRTVPTLERIELRKMGSAREGKPALLRTAPGWLPVLGLVLLLPTPRRRRQA